MISTSEDNVNLAVEFLRRKKYDETADMLLALKARAEVAEKRVKELEEVLEEIANAPLYLGDDHGWIMEKASAALEAKP